MQFRRHIYWKYFSSIKTSSIPVIAIGNIAWGGTGKTPLVDYIVQYCLQKNILPTIISRGYKSSPPHFPFLISPEEDSALIAGDEPLMLAKKYPTISCIIDPKRSRAAEYALKNLKQDFFLLDDAFQHMSLKKDTTICLLRAEDITEQWNNVIPYGSWREDASALHYADAFCMKITPSHFESIKKDIEKRLKKYPRPFYTFTLAITSLIHFRTREEIFSLDSDYSIFSAIGNSSSFYNSITNFLEKKPLHHYIKKDHSSFSSKEINEFNDNILICTKKDAVKIPPSINKNIFVASTKIVWGPYLAEHSFNLFLDSILANIK